MNYRALLMGLAFLLLSGCLASLPKCQMPSAGVFNTGSQTFLVFEGENIAILDAMMQKLSKGECALK